MIEFVQFPALYTDMAHADYLGFPAVSNSGLKQAAKSPWHYMKSMQPRPVPEKAPTAPLFGGTLLHCALLEFDQFATRFPIGPDVAKTSKAWKEFAASLDAAATPITPVQAEIAIAQAASLKAETNVAEIFSLPGLNEVSVFWKDEESGLLCKARPDRAIRTDAGTILFDAKTTRDASRAGFAKACANYGYAQQAAWYERGWKAATGEHVIGMVFGVVESEYPYAAAAYMLEDVAVSAANARCSELLRLLGACERAQRWPAYPDGMSEPLALPAWAMRAMEDTAPTSDEIYA